MYIQTLCSQVLNDSRLWGENLLPFTATLAEGYSRVALVAGENCSGKSLFVETLRSWAKHRCQVSSICVSIRERTGAGTYEMSSFRRTMMFGDESEHSTGATSAKVVETAFANANSWGRDDRKPTLLVLDEPELGLSEGYACAMGALIGQRVLELDPGVVGVAVVSHSRGLARALAETLGQAPAFVKLGEAVDFATWLAAVETRSVDELRALGKLDHERWRLVQQALDEQKKKK